MRRLSAGPGTALAALGVGLSLTAAAYHLGAEAAALGSFYGPLLAFALDGLPPLALVYGGVFLSRTDVPRNNQWIVVSGALVGVVTVTLFLSASVAVRVVEGRGVSEPVFVLLVGATAGALLGALTGYYAALARTDADHAEDARQALGVVNRVLRHDLRNDMTVIDGHARLIESEAEGDVADSALVITEQTAAALDLVDSTGAIAETLRGETTEERVDLVSLVSSVLDATEGDATLLRDLPASAHVTANDGLRSVVDNLVENAVEHNESPTVRVSVERDAETVTLRVADDGDGIPPERRERLFEPRPDAADGGGLHLVATLVTAYGGSIRVEDGDPGTTFVVTLPRAD